MFPACMVPGVGQAILGVKGNELLAKATLPAAASGEANPESRDIGKSPLEDSKTPKTPRIARLDLF